MNNYGRTTGVTRQTKMHILFMGHILLENSLASWTLNEKLGGLLSPLISMPLKSKLS